MCERQRADPESTFSGDGKLLGSVFLDSHGKLEDTNLEGSDACDLRGPGGFEMAVVLVGRFASPFAVPDGDRGCSSVVS